MTQKKIRIEVVDAMRGFAILAIMLLHSIEHFNFYVFPAKNTQPDWLNNLDTHIWDSLFFMFGGKGYAIFSILFGFTFSLMMVKQLKQGKDFGYRFLWRMLLLVGFALVNGALFPGEVLLMYAILGVSLFFVRNLKTQVLLIIALFFALQPLEWFRFIEALTNPDLVLNAKKSSPLWSLLKEGQSGTSFWNLIKTNTLYGHKASLYWAFEVGRMSQTIALFVIGFCLGKNNKFEDNVQNTKFWTKVLIIGAITFIPLYVLNINLKSIFEQEILIKTFKPISDMYKNIAFTSVLVSSFILLFKTSWFKKIAGGLKYPGRMSLTAYIMQSVIGGFVFYGYGLGIGPHVRHTIALLIGIGLFAIQFYFCKWWINKYGQGPLERLWHKLTWIRYKKVSTWSVKKC